MFLHTWRCRPDNAILFASTIRHNLDNLRREGGSTVCKHIFAFTIVLSSWCSKIPFKKSFPFYFRVDLMVENPLTIPVSENLFLFHSWKIISQGPEFWVDGSFFAALEKCCATTFWLSWFLWKIGHHLNGFCSFCKVSFLLLLLTYFVFKSSIVWSLIMMFPGMDFFGFVHSEFCSNF